MAGVGFEENAHALAAPVQRTCDEVGFELDGIIYLLEDQCTHFDPERSQATCS